MNWVYIFFSYDHETYISMNNATNFLSTTKQYQERNNTNNKVLFDVANSHKMRTYENIFCVTLFDR